MTAETSNARGELRPGIDRLWDSQWVNIVNSPEVLEAMGFRDCEEAVNIAVRMTEQAMAKNFAAARGDVRGLVALAERVQYADTHALVSKDDAGEFVCLPPWLWLEIRDAAVEALAADGVQAGEVEQRARELLAQHCECGGGMQFTKTSDALRAIASALSQKPEARVYQCPRCATSMEVDPTAKPEARGVVDVDKVFHSVCAYVSPADRSYFRKALTAALTEARNVR